MLNFNELDLSQKLIRSLKKIGYETLTPIQEKVIPNILENKDILACSQTGSGKTGAFLIPIISGIYSSMKENSMVVVPTRELAIQIRNSVKEFTDKDKGLQTALIIGGEKIEPQLRDLKKNPRIIIGTPGRINDHIRSKNLNLDKFHTLVLDEMDRMLDMGFSTQIDEILETMPSGRQTLLFSATATKRVEEKAQKYLNNPITIKIGEANQPSKNIEEKIVELKNSEKFNKLLDIVKGSEDYFLIFAGTQNSVTNISDKLNEYALNSKPIHGGLRQRQRDSVIKSFRNKKFNILVATDIAARGLDIHHIDYVINYDMPKYPEDYIHRIGRASRSENEKGTAISFTTSGDQAIWKGIKKLIKEGDYEELSFEKKGEKDMKRRTFNKNNKNNKEKFNKRSSFTNTDEINKYGKARRQKNYGFRDENNHFDKPRNNFKRRDKRNDFDEDFVKSGYKRTTSKNPVKRNNFNRDTDFTENQTEKRLFHENRRDKNKSFKKTGERSFRKFNEDSSEKTFKGQRKDLKTRKSFKAKKIRQSKAAGNTPKKRKK